MEKQKSLIFEGRGALIKEIENARRNALSSDELDPIKDEQDRITNEFLNGTLTGKEYDEQMLVLDRQEGVIRKKTIAEYGSLLRAMNIPEDTVRETLAHENEHMAESVRSGMKPVYQVQFLRTIGVHGVEIGMYPSIYFDFPPDMPDEERRRVLKAIIEAPEGLSPRDHSQLGLKDIES